jgi:hypothetical protein
LTTKQTRIYARRLEREHTKYLSGGHSRRRDV